MSYKKVYSEFKQPPVDQMSPYFYKMRASDVKETTLAGKSTKAAYKTRLIDPSSPRGKLIHDKLSKKTAGIPRLIFSRIQSASKRQHLIRMYHIVVSPANWRRPRRTGVFIPGIRRKRRK